MKQLFLSLGCGFLAGLGWSPLVLIERVVFVEQHNVPAPFQCTVPLLIGGPQRSFFCRM